LLMRPGKHRVLPPRRLRLDRAQRLQSARQWLKQQTCRTPVQSAKSYRKWFGLDLRCAVQELEMLGIRLDADWVANLHCSLEGAQRARRQRAEGLDAQMTDYDPDSGQSFAYIAGCTPGGAPYGVTWEEWRTIEAEKR
jgi:hypothetical protein